MIFKVRFNTIQITHRKFDKKIAHLELINEFYETYDKKNKLNALQYLYHSIIIFKF